MPLKVSLDFLEGPIPKVVSTCNRIAKSMTGNQNYPYPPITPGGLQTSVKELDTLQKKTIEKKGRFDGERDIALADVKDFVQQIAPYVEHACKNNLEILLSSGFDQNMNVQVRAKAPVVPGIQF